MSHNLGKLLFISALLLLAHPLLAQGNPCSNPQTFRVGIFITDKPAHDSDPQAYKSRLSIENHYRSALLKQLPGPTCIVDDPSVFDDAANYPMLKGSLVFRINADQSVDHPEVLALAVDIYFTEGIYTDQILKVGVFPVLIEKDTDCELGAKETFGYWQTMTNFIADRDKKSR